jgi:tetrahydromethanopterin S-methyltransferase subunit B
MSTLLPPETKIVIVGEERWSSFAVFNGNAFPCGLEELVDSCSTRAAILLIHLEEVRSEIERDRLRFVNSLENQRNDLTTAVTSRPDLRPVGYYDGLGYIAALYGFLIGIKSFLDLYAQLMAKVALPSASMTFKRTKIGDN